MDKYIGKRLDGRYEIREVIGVGGMAYVYKAYDTIDDRIVAIKILKDEFLANEEFTRRFKNESKAIAILSHPNIVKVFDVSFGDRLQYIVMEYIDGITLKEYIEQQKVIPWKESVHFCVQILRALQHAHDKGIVHRDIKPQNIMLLSDGTIKVTDFGIARFARQDIRLTGEADKAIGSVHYISPEQARGAITDEKADIYSVGVMLYEMLTGCLPFEADNAVSVAIMQMQAEPKKPSAIKSDIPDGLEEITLKAMQKDPAARYQSAAEMLNDIDEFKRNPSIHFEYAYFKDDTPTRYVETISMVRGEVSHDTADTGDNDDEEEVKSPPVIPILVAITGALVLVVLLFLGAIFLLGIFKDNTPDDITVPDFRGMNINEVLSNPDNQIYNIDEDKCTYDNSTTIPKDHIIEQSHTKMKPAQRLTFKISKGPKQAIVPSFSTNEDLADIKARITAAGLYAQEVMETSDTVPEGKVIGLSPESGTTVDEQSTVKIFVSNGPKPVDPVSMVNVVSVSSIDIAKQRIKDAGLVINDADIQYVNVSDTNAYPTGTVCEQSPKAGESVLPGTNVTLKVSTGYTDVKIPLVLPKNYDQPVDVAVYVDSVHDTAKDKKGILLQDYQAGNLIFTNKKDTYVVTIRIKASSGTEWQTISKYSVNGKTGSISLDESHDFIPPVSTATTTQPPPTTSTEQNTDQTEPDPEIEDTE